jgi:hypothetical protein
MFEVSFLSDQKERKHPTRRPEEVVRDTRLAFVLSARIALQFRSCQRSGCGLGLSTLGAEALALIPKLVSSRAVGSKATGIL